MNTDPKVTAWRKSSRHLPPFLRDFHDAKKVFKTIGFVYSEKTNDNYNVGWTNAQVYTIDRFLWFMASHGYTLQRSRQKLPFNKLSVTIGEMEEAAIESLRGILGEIGQPHE